MGRKLRGAIPTPRSRIEAATPYRPAPSPATAPSGEPQGEAAAAGPPPNRPDARPGKAEGAGGDGPHRET